MGVATATFDRERELAEAITPTVESALPDVEVLAVELLSPTRFCVYVDHPQGVDLALCERVTRLLAGYREEWTIDVSSPGPDRPIRRAVHFGTAVGRDVQLRTSAEVSGRTRFRGQVVAADDTQVSVRCDDTTFEIPVELIVRGNLIDEGR